MTNTIAGKTTAGVDRLKSNALDFRPDLQGLRAVAILLVVFSHAGFEVLEGGFIGVDIFFVLSGYLITGLLLNEYESTNRVNFLRFYARRLKRLLPSLLLVIAVTLLAASMFLSSFEFIAKTRSSFYAISWLSNFYFAFTEVGYFAEMEQQDLFLHTWSLGVEEQFYLFWPALILVLLGLARFVNRSKQSVLILSLVVIFTGSLLLCLYWGMNRPLWAFYLMPARIWQFSLGALTFILSFSGKYHYVCARNNLLAQTSAVAAIFLCALWISSSMTYPGWVAIFPSFAAAAVMLAPVAGIGSGLLNRKVLIYIGDRSYAWYLWHWPVFSLAKSGGLDNLWHQKLGLIILSFLMAEFSHRLVEIRFWKGQFSRFSDGRTVTGALVAILATVAVTLNVLVYHQKNSLRSSTEELAAAASDVPVIYPYSCDTWYESAEVRPCVFEDKSFTKTFVFFGDSILAQWFSLFSYLYPPPEWRIIVFTKSACPIVDEDYYYPRIGSVYEVCRTWRDDVLAGLERIRPDVVLIGSSNNYEFTEEQWVMGSARIFDTLRKVSPKNYVLIGTPELGRNGPACLLKNAPSVGLMRERCSTEAAMSEARRVGAYLGSASARYDGVTVLDFNQLVCPDDHCFAITRDGVVVYRDSQHLTDTFVRGLRGEVLKRYPELVPVTDKS